MATRHCLSMLSQYDHAFIERNDIEEKYRTASIQPARLAAIKKFVSTDRLTSCQILAPGPLAIPHCSIEVRTDPVAELRRSGLHLLRDHRRNAAGNIHNCPCPKPKHLPLGIFVRGCGQARPGDPLGLLPGESSVGGALGLSGLPRVDSPALA